MRRMRFNNQRHDLMRLDARDNPVTKASEDMRQDTLAVGLGLETDWPRIDDLAVGISPFVDRAIPWRHPADGTSQQSGAKVHDGFTVKRGLENVGWRVDLHVVCAVACHMAVLRQRSATRPDIECEISSRFCYTCSPYINPNI